MRNRSALALAALVAAALMGIAAGLASAGRLSVSNRTIRAMWSNVEMYVTNPGEEGAQYGNICRLTLEGSFHSATIRKVVGTLIGYVSRVSVAACTDPDIIVTALREALPWHVRYQSFSGTLPAISGLTLAFVGMSWEFFVGGALRCLLRSTTVNPAIASIEVRSGVLGRVTWNPERVIPHPPVFPCQLDGELHMMGVSSPITVLGASTAVSVTLI
jgi:hypothetical protein